MIRCGGWRNSRRRQERVRILPFVHRGYCSTSPRRVRVRRNWTLSRSCGILSETTRRVGICKVLKWNRGEGGWGNNTRRMS